MQTIHCRLASGSSRPGMSWWTPKDLRRLAEQLFLIEKAVSICFSHCIAPLLHKLLDVKTLLP